MRLSLSKGFGLVLHLPRSRGRFLGLGIDMDQHVLRRGDHHLLPQAGHFVEQVQAFPVTGQHAAAHFDRFAKPRLTQMAQVTFHRVPGMPARDIVQPRADPRQHDVGRIAEQLEIGPFGEVFVVINPFRLDRGGNGLEPPFAINRAVRARLPAQPFAVRLGHRARGEIVAFQRVGQVDQAVIAQPFIGAQIDIAGLLVALLRHGVDQLVGQLGADQLGPGPFH